MRGDLDSIIEEEDVDATERFITQKLSLIDQYIDADEVDIPDCSEEELWMGPPEYKYFAKTTAKRATKNFGEDYYGAQQMLAEKGTGEVRTISAKAKKCNYCNAASICSQRARLFEQNLID